ncbi:hypothetical protein [Paludifilum halophilum]|uniref:Uncharacterized protein n=1 Tax=Paludifilum halophilum TaxID=1642702 RepID=A0A235B576_9BACL|nr:hypothetical protein [Paludifilum halophilum]OYD07456.1 hypothetical protein CHM34_11175 [Paludifilum halophilum]
MKTHHWIAILLGSLCFLALIVGVYFLPSDHAVVKVNDPDATALQLSIMANQISSMNYLLTFIGLTGAIAGVAFTIFGYYQSTKFPKLVENELSKHLSKIYRQIDHLNLEQQTLKDSLSSLEEKTKSPYNKSMEESEWFVDRAKQEYDTTVERLLISPDSKKETIINDYRESISKIIFEYRQSVYELHCYLIDDDWKFPETFTLKQLHKYVHKFKT